MDTEGADGNSTADTGAFYVGGWSYAKHLAPASAGQVQAFGGDLLSFSHGVRQDAGPDSGRLTAHVQLFSGASGEPVATADQSQAMSSALQDEGVNAAGGGGDGNGQVGSNLTLCPDPDVVAGHVHRGSGGLHLAAAGQVQAFGHLLGCCHGAGHDRGPSGEPVAAADQSQAMSSALQEEGIKAAGGGGDGNGQVGSNLTLCPDPDVGRGGRDAGRHRDAQWQHLPDLPGEGGGERGGEEPHVEPGVAARRRPVRRDLEAAERTEEQGHVQVGDADEGDRAASLDQVPRRTGSAPVQDQVPDQVPVQDAIIVHTVWRENCDEVFKRVVDKFRQPRRHLYVALDLEFVAGASMNVHFRPFCWNTWYDQLRTFVNGGEMLQVGLALTFDLDHQHGGAQAPSPVIALEINLKFDVDAREYNDASITFLSDQGHCLAEHRDRGVTTEQFVNGLLRHLPFGDHSVTWVIYHGDRDFGFLLRLLHTEGRAALPSDRAAFMRQVRRQFPLFYDVRVLGQLEKEGFTGSLTALAASLGVRRIGGEHHAGSDALLTLSCFKVIHHRNEHKPHRLHSRQCLLSGMEEFDMGIKCARHIDDPSVITVEVRGHNFEAEARLINELVTSNFQTVGIDVQLPPLGCGIPFYAADAQQDYELMRSILRGIDEFPVTIGFMNAEGMLAYGRVWKFYLSSRADPAVAGGGNNAYVRPGQLAWLMASCGATHNPNVTWVAYQGSLGIACLIKSFLAAVDLPIDWSCYIEHQRGLFPNLYDAGLIAQGCPDIAGHPLGLGTLLAPQALHVLRCYKRLAESPCFPHIAEAVQGQLMASQSYFWY